MFISNALLCDVPSLCAQDWWRYQRFGEKMFLKNKNLCKFLNICKFRNWTMAYHIFEFPILVDIDCSLFYRPDSHFFLKQTVFEME